MLATCFALFLALACCQALLVVKLADRLSPTESTGRGAAEAVGAGSAVGLA